MRDVDAMCAHARFFFFFFFILRRLLIMLISRFHLMRSAAARCLRDRFDDMLMPADVAARFLMPTLSSIILRSFFACPAAPSSFSFISMICSRRTYYSRLICAHFSMPADLICRAILMFFDALFSRCFLFALYAFIIHFHDMPDFFFADAP